MAASILSQDFLAICLIVSEGDLNKNIQEVVIAVEKFQQDGNRHFGITQHDFQGIIGRLMKSGYMNDEEFKETRLRDILHEILNYEYAHFNDGGEDWVFTEKQVFNKDDYATAEYWYGYTREEFDKKNELKKAMKVLFKDANNSRKELVINFMKEFDINKKLLLHCSRAGESS